MQFANYQTEGFHDEMFDATGAPRDEARLLVDTIASLDEGQFLRCQRSAERVLLQLGITFNVYGDSAGAERISPSISSPASSLPVNGPGWSAASSSASASSTPSSMTSITTRRS